MKSVPLNSRRGMIFDLVCRGCGTCAQREWDATEAVAATMCPRCEGAMSVIGIDFPAGRSQVALTKVLEVVHGAGIVPVAVERHARAKSRSDAA